MSTSSGAADSAWTLLQTYLQRYRDDGDLCRYHRCTVAKLLQYGFALPVCLIADYKVLVCAIYTEYLSPFIIESGSVQRCIAKHGGGYTQKGVAYVYCIRYTLLIYDHWGEYTLSKKPGGWCTAYTRVYPQYTTASVYNHIYDKYTKSVQNNWSK